MRIVKDPFTGELLLSLDTFVKLRARASKIHLFEGLE